MIINKFSGVERTKKARGITVVIDIIRAATVEAFLLDKDAKEVIPVATPEEGKLIEKVIKVL